MAAIFLIETPVRTDFAEVSPLVHRARGDWPERAQRNALKSCSSSARHRRRRRARRC